MCCHISFICARNSRPVLFFPLHTMHNLSNTIICNAINKIEYIYINRWSALNNAQLWLCYLFDGLHRGPIRHSRVPKSVLAQKQKQNKTADDDGDYLIAAFVHVTEQNEYKKQEEKTLLLFTQSRYTHNMAALYGYYYCCINNLYITTDRSEQ